MEKDGAPVLVCSSMAAMSTLILGSILLYIFFTLTKQTEHREPPGPRPLPLFGNLLQLDLQRPYLSFQELSKKYGSIFQVYFGHQKVVVVAGHKTLREALVNHGEQFGERYIHPIFKEGNLNHGILFSNGDSWKEMRRFSLSTLRDFGMGKRGAEEKILEESEHLVQAFKSQQGKPFDTTSHLTHATANVVLSIVYGSRFEYSDPRFQELVNRTNDNIRLIGSPEIQLYNMFPHLFGWTKCKRQVTENFSQTLHAVGEMVNSLKQTLTRDTCRGLVDRYLLQMQKEEASEVSNPHFNETNLVITVTNLFAGGTDTTSATLKWGLLLMAKYPHIQDQVQEELSRVVGNNEVKVEDRKNMPFTDAVVHETLRFASVLPLSLPHQTARDVTIQGLFIKAGTIVVPLLYSALNDENSWESPHKFNPSNFLDNDGKFVKNVALMPFSAGHRACPGESLAKMELFLLFTSLLRHFRFTPPPGISEDELDLTSAVGFTRCPVPHQLCAISRF